MESTLARKVRDAKGADGSGCVGITTYLTQTLLGGKPFRVKNSKTSGGPETGLKIGRYNDNLWSRHVAGEISLDSGNFKHQRCCRLRNHISGLGYVPVRTQLMVTLIEFGICTPVDVVCVSKSGDRLLIGEIKCTQKNSEKHAEDYHKKCIGKATLRNKCEATEYVLHQLQLSMGVIGARRMFPGIEVTGRVFVCTSDRTVSYPCESRFLHASLFSVPHTTAAAPRKVVDKVRLNALPESLSDRSSIHRLLQLNGYTKMIDSSGKYGSFVVSRGGKVTVVGILHDPPGNRKKRLASATSLVKSAAKRYEKKHGKKAETALVLFSSSKPMTLVSV